METDAWLRNVLTKHYKVFGDTSFELEGVPSYTNLWTIYKDDTTFFLKRLPYGTRDFDFLFASLHEYPWMNVPLQADSGYCVVEADCLFVLYPLLHEVFDMPDATWWGNVLGELHQAFPNGGPNLCGFPLIRCNAEYARQMFAEAGSCMPTDIRLHLRGVLEGALNLKVSPCDLVLCHGDPLPSNVMSARPNGSELRLIDFASCGFAPREYDCQRVVSGCLAAGVQANYCIALWRDLAYYYRINTGIPLSDDTFEYLYRCDLVQTLSWLSIVCNEERPDAPRQLQELKRYERSLRSGAHNLFLESRPVW